MVDIINFCFGVDKFDQVTNNLYNVFPGKYLNRHFGFEAKFLVDPVAAHFPEVISLVGEEEFIDNVSCCCLIGRFSITKLAVNINDCFLFGVAGIFLKSIVYNGEIRKGCILPVEKDCLCSGIDNNVDMICLDNCFPVEDYLISFY